MFHSNRFAGLDAPMSLLPVPFPERLIARDIHGPRSTRRATEKSHV
jgi:hypothetical protein